MNVIQSPDNSPFHRESLILIAQSNTGISPHYVRTSVNPHDCESLD